MEAEALVGSYTEQIISQVPCNGRYSSSNPVRVTIVANKWGWCWDSWKLNSVLARELSKQLATFSHVKVSFFVPEGSCDENDKGVAKSHKVTIVEAKKQPGFQDPNEWLYFPPKDLTTDFVIGVGEGLCKMAQIFKEYHHCKSIFVGWDSFEESLCRKSKLRNALVKVDSEILERKSNLQPLMETADHVVAKGPKMAEELSRFLSYRKKRVFKFTPGILSEFTDITQTTDDRKEFHILIAGHDNPSHFKKEGLKVVAEAVAGLKEGSYKIIFVGAAEGKENFEKFVEEFHKCGVPEHQLIIRNPPKDEEEFKRWLCEADLAIMPSAEQEFGMFGLTALSSGLPILVHGASGLGEALTHVPGGSSFIVESEDVSEWSKVIKKVRDKGRTLRLKEAVLLRKHYNKVYSWEKQCGALVEMLKMASAQQGKTQ
nr:uncharacterized protein LOC131792237 [Pocillopora verrucosa]